MAPPKKSTTAVAAQRRRKQAEDMDDLQKELELVDHGMTWNGQRRRQLTKQQAKKQTQTRKLLEQKDDWNRIEQGDASQPRIRGSRAAEEDRVIQGSLIFGAATKKPAPAPDRRGQLKKVDSKEDASEESDNEEEEEESSEGSSTGESGDDSFVEDENEVEDEEEDGDNAEDMDDDDDEGGDDDADTEFEEPSSLLKQKPNNDSKRDGPPSDQTSTSKVSARRPYKRRRLVRMRSFTSKKMAQQHGDALGAHARGKPNVAIRKLKQVAKTAPSAPQIYSSLGMVYEDMLHESQQRRQLQASMLNEGTDGDFGNNEADNRGTSTKRVSFDTGLSGSRRTPDVSDETALTEQLGLARKAYGSYHAAAILCKGDYNLWLRAGDAACEVADLHTTIMRMPGLSEESSKFHRNEKRRWLEEAKNDYGIGDNLNPPGIDISAKYAYVLIELGMLSEALTLMTDLKDRPEFIESYRGWVLYSDLMLRVGHECTQWNRGVQTTSNFMFRRWLRKFSDSFDWQERRLQGLVKAMEAACGTKCCSALLLWLHQRVEKKAPSNDKSADKERGESGEKSAEDEAAKPHDIDFECEKQLLLRRNANELAAFDKATRELDSTNATTQMKERQQSRSDLVKRHKASLITLVGEYRERCATVNPSSSNHEVENMPHNFSTELELSLSASIPTSCSIASELMRHMIVLKLYDGGKLVGEAVSLYLKERAMLRDKRVQSQKKVTESTSEGFSSIFAMNQQSYDKQKGDDVGGSDDEDSVSPLSDDDDLDCGDEETVLGPLRRGILPPEIQLLYGVCLAGEGGKAFLAAQCIRVMNELEQEPSSWFSTKVVDTNVSTDSMWIVFHASMTEPLGRTAAFAFVADAVQKSGRELDLIPRLVDLFQKRALDLSAKGLVDLVVNRKQRVHSIARYRQDLVLKILVTASRYGVESAELQALPADVTYQSSLLYAMDSLSKVVPVVWKVGVDGSLSLRCIEIIDCVARTFGLLSNCLSDSKEAAIEEAFSQAVKLVSVFSGSKLTLSDKMKRWASDLTTFPLLTSWLSDDLSSLSLRTHNLCVANNVSLFSGWESEQFAIHLLRGQNDSFFGVEMEGGVVAGWLPESVENALAHQWGLVRQLVRTSPSFDFAAKLYALRTTDWYKQVRKRHDKMRNKVQIVQYGEDHALSALISFSRACLISASSNKGNENGENGKLLFIALSILLPASQFCLNEGLWDTEIGRNDETSIAPRIRPWQDFSTNTEDRIFAHAERPGYVRPSKRAVQVFHEGKGERDVFEWFDWEDENDPMANLIALPLSIIGREWRRLRNKDNDENMQSASKELMSRLDGTVKSLRASRSAQMIEIVSLHVASSLLQLAACSGCSNPFLCIQQAAMFASQGPKGGASDRAFHTKLPKPDACTPLEALLTVGRAECLLAVHFYQEAAFLCNFVANVCSRHRDQDRQVQQDARWKIVAALAYDLSVMIRNLSRAVIFEKRLKEDTSGAWDSASIEEFKHARSEGLQWKYSEPKAVSQEQQFQTTRTAIELNIVETAGHTGGQPKEAAVQNFDCSTETLHDFTVPMMDLDVPEIGDEDDDSVDALNVYAV